jgi:hypothetical protein
VVTGFTYPYLHTRAIRYYEEKGIDLPDQCYRPKPKNRQDFIIGLPAIRSA